MSSRCRTGIRIQPTTGTGTGTCTVSAVPVKNSMLVNFLAIVSKTELHMYLIVLSDDRKTSEKEMGLLGTILRFLNSKGYNEQ
jgi:hypothetical protein